MNKIFSALLSVLLFLCIGGILQYALPFHDSNIFVRLVVWVFFAPYVVFVYIVPFLLLELWKKRLSFWGAGMGALLLYLVGYHPPKAYSSSFSLLDEIGIWVIPIMIFIGAMIGFLAEYGFENMFTLERKNKASF